MFGENDSEETLKLLGVDSLRIAAGLFVRWGLDLPISVGAVAIYTETYIYCQLTLSIASRVKL